MSGGQLSTGNTRRILPVAVVVLLLSVSLALSASVPTTSAAAPPGFPLVVLYGTVTYSDGSAAPNVDVTVTNETSGISLSDITDEKGVWTVTIETGSPLGGCGDAVLIVAKDAWNNEVSERVTIICDEEPLQRVDLAFAVPLPTATPTATPDGGGNGGSSSNGGGSSDGGTPTTTPKPTPTPTPTATPTPTPTATSTPTPTATPAVTPAPSTTISPGVTSTPLASPTAKPGIPGFELIFAIAGLLAMAQWLRRERN